MSRIILTAKIPTEGIVEEKYDGVYLCSYRTNPKRLCAKSNIKPTKVNMSLVYNTVKYSINGEYIFDPESYIRITNSSNNKPVRIKELSCLFYGSHDSTEKVLLSDSIGIFTTAEECIRYYQYLVDKAIMNLDEYYNERKKILLSRTELSKNSINKLK